MGYTWTEIAGYVNEVAGKEGAKPNASFLRLLANQALRVISRRALVYEKVWTNDGGRGVDSERGGGRPAGGLLRGGPGGMGRKRQRTPLSVHPVARSERVGMADGDGGAELSHARRGDTSCSIAFRPRRRGKLVVRGRGPLPDFSEEAEAENPLAWLPTDHQLLPAYYVLKELPVDPSKPMAIQRRQDAETRWAEGLAELVAAVATREDQAFRF